jgi:DNA modification methylase
VSGINLSDDERAEVKRLIDVGESLPDKYRFRLFAEPREAELIWPGKTSDITNVVLPFQSIEQIDEPRAESGAQVGDLFAMGAGGRQSSGWSNKLIWGDNKLVLSSLKGGPLRREIERAGGLKLVYIDPPFDVGADFSVEIVVGDDTVVKEPTTIEDIAYRDTWGRGKDSYASMLYERLSLIHQLMAPDGCLFVHSDWRVDSHVRLIADDIFGENGFFNEIVWSYFSFKRSTSKKFPQKHDIIVGYRKSPDSFTWKPQYKPHKAEYLKRFKTDSSGRLYRDDVNPTAGGTRIIYLDEVEGDLVDSVWDDIPPVNPVAQERTDYATQKPEGLVDRLIDATTNPGDLVADFFCGSGTTLAVAEKCGRKWIGCDLGRFAIHTSRKRLIGVQRQLKREAKPYRAFEILNLGKYERQWFVGIDPTLPPEERARAQTEKEGRYVALILEAYAAEPVEQTPPFHGKKGDALVYVGPVDSPITEGAVHDAVTAARALNIGKVDLLGFEFEMGIAPRMVDEARAKGVAVALRYIPKEVFDRRAVDKGQVRFDDLAYVEATATVVNKHDREVTVSLTNFAVSYRQDDVDSLIADMRAGTRVTVDGGQVVKLVKAKDGKVEKTVLTNEWTDWIDYCAVDFDYLNRPEKEVITTQRADGTSVDVEQWTNRYIFENEWQSFRTRKNRAIELTSIAHKYDSPGRKAIAVRVIDIFGNDTTKVIGVEV